MAGRPTVEVLALCGIVFLVQEIIVLTVNIPTATALFVLSRPFFDAPWTIATSVYAHGSITHLLGNAFVILLAGLPIERSTTRLRFHGFVLGTGAFAGIAQVVVTDGAVLGASGAAFALLGYLLTGNRVASGFFQLLAVPPRVLIAGFALIAIVIAVFTHSPGVALVGHFAGLFIGLVAGYLNLLRTSKHNPQVKT